MFYGCKVGLDVLIMYEDHIHYVAISIMYKRLFASRDLHFRDCNHPDKNVHAGLPAPGFTKRHGNHNKDHRCHGYCWKIA